MAGTLLRGGLLYDPRSETFAPGDLRIEGERIAAPRSPASVEAGSVAESAAPRAVRDSAASDTAASDTVIDVTGLIVTPGLVDLHTHIFRGQDLGLPAEDLAASSGTTTLVDAGSAGGHLFDAFRRTSVDGSPLRIRAFVNISSVGTTSILLAGELMTLQYADEDVAVECIENNRDVVVGVKIRASGNVGGGNVPIALRRARSVADRVGLPLMVHLGPAPAAIDEIAALLGPGDILTHAFTGWQDNRIISDGRLRDAVKAARDRGALLDVGHGMSGFSAEVAEIMVCNGELPDTISSDLHAYSRSHSISMPRVLARLMALGMSLEQVLARATLAPANAVGLASSGVGTLGRGAPADVAVFRRVHAPVDFTDGFGMSFSGAETLEPVLTIMGGRVVFDARDGFERGYGDGPVARPNSATPDSLTPNDGPSCDPGRSQP